ncbi:MAG: septum formation initiator family protein [Bacilli bacterium]|nr:septum formation initiator family protein [Bacilli bacterium]
MKKKAKRRLLIFGSISVFLIFYFIFNLVSTVYRYYDLKKTKSFLERDLYILKENEYYLRLEYEKLQDKDYIARWARENYLYSKDSEFVIRINPAAINNEVEEENLKSYVYIIIGLGITTLLIFTRRKKKKQR